MYGLAEDVDLSFLVGQTLTQICIGQHDLQLHFQPTASLHLGGNEFSLDGQRLHVRDAHRIASQMSVLLGSTVSQVSREGDGDLRLKVGPAQVVIHDSNAPHYESYTINNGSDAIVV